MLDRSNEGDVETCSISSQFFGAFSRNSEVWKLQLSALARLTLPLVGEVK